MDGVNKVLKSLKPIKILKISVTSEKKFSDNRFCTRGSKHRMVTKGNPGGVKNICIYWIRYL